MARESIVFCKDCGSKVLSSYYAEHGRSTCTGRRSIAGEENTPPKAASKKKPGRPGSKRTKRTAKPVAPGRKGRKSGKRKQMGRRNGRSSLFAKRPQVEPTPEQVIARERIQRRGFHEGAFVPGSSIRKIDK